MSMSGRVGQVADNSAWVSDMADALRAELAAAEAVREGKGPWLTVSAAYGHQAGALPRDPSTTYGWVSQAIGRGGVSVDRGPTPRGEADSSVRAGKASTFRVAMFFFRGRLSLTSVASPLSLALTNSSSCSCCSLESPASPQPFASCVYAVEVSAFRLSPDSVEAAPPAWRLQGLPPASVQSLLRCDIVGRKHLCVIHAVLSREYRY